MESVEESNRYLSNLNSLYLSSVEALAMVIDFKDQVTRGQIGRVQEAVVVMGKRLWIHGSDELMTLRAGALLHDLGKIGVPEHILNQAWPAERMRVRSDEDPCHDRGRHCRADEVFRIRSSPSSGTTMRTGTVQAIRWVSAAPIFRWPVESWPWSIATTRCVRDRPYRRGMDDREAMLDHSGAARDDVRPHHRRRVHQDPGSAWARRRRRRVDALTFIDYPDGVASTRATQSRLWRTRGRGEPSRVDSRRRA